MATFKSNLDANAQEFISSVEINRRKCLGELTSMLEPIFEGGSAKFDAQLKKARQASMTEGVNAPRLMGEVITDLATTSPTRATTGFRFFQRLREGLPEHRSQEAVTGVINSLHKMTKNILSGSLLTRMMNNQVNRYKNCANGNRCEEAGDVPTRSTPIISTDNAFGILTFLNLVVTRLNPSDTPEEYVCPPPILSSIDLCLLVERTCSLVSCTSQNANTLKTADLERQLDVSLIICDKNWTGWLYQLLDIFLQSLVHFNYLLNSLSVRIPLDNWYRGGQVFSFSPSDAQFYPEFSCGPQIEEQPASYFPVLLTRTLTWMRKLLIDGSFSQNTVRHIAVDSLMTMGELIVTTNATWNAPENPMNFELSSELSDEAEESLAIFMKESNQLI